MTKELKAQLVAAHRAQDWETAALLSLRKNEERAKARKIAHCERCGVRIHSAGYAARCAGRHCIACRNFLRHVPQIGANADL